jgi:colanic acid/amylovoran biosynthesis glycosyltransferase
MRIGLVLAATPPYSETFFRNKIRILTEAGYEVVLLTDKQKGRFEGCKERVGFSFKSMWGGGIIIALWRLLVFFPQSIKLAKANRSDGFSLKQNVLSLLTSAHMLGLRLNWLHFGFATMAIDRENVAGAIGAKMAVSVRGSDLHVYPIEHPQCYRLMWQRIDRLHPISNYLLQLALKDGFNSAKANACIISPAIDTDLFSPPKYREANPIPIICTVARLHWIKGLEYVLEAMALLHQKGIVFEYHIIGEGDEYKSLYFAAHQLKISELVFFHGKQPQTFINEFLSKADLFIMYSLDEGFCNSVLEAQAMGCLSLISNTPALMENVIDGETGWVVPARNAKALAQSVEKVLDLPQTDIDRIRENAMLRVKEKFNLSIQKQAFVNFYADNASAITN